jgi:NAD(P)-dependent dehydrogenase (short-subunit alcohol dehydrogenase family)
VVTYYRERDRAVAVVDEIGKGEGDAIAVQFDLASPGSVSRAVGAALERWGQVDGFGRIVSISSGVAADGFPGTAPYGAAKAALHGLTKTLSKELAPAGILVNVVMPGLRRTERMVARLPTQALELSAQASPLRRLPGPDEVATAIVYLCSGANTAITGEIVRVGGGAT